MTCMYLMCHISGQDVIENDRKKMCVCVCMGKKKGGGWGADAIKLSIIMHFCVVDLEPD